MSMPLWAIELAGEFWRSAGEAESYPRALEEAAAFAFPLTVIVLPRLSVFRVSAWLRGLLIRCLVHEGERPLRACLFARDGWGLIFLDAADTEDERRFSLAHELAHFLRHYWQPRRRAVARFGESILEVFDGKRQPTVEERLHALLRHVHVGEHLHLLARDDSRRIASSRVADAEDDADRLGCELLAPSALIVRQCRKGTAHESRLVAEQRLQAEYGLPCREAHWYATQLYPRVEDPLLKRLGISS